MVGGGVYAVLGGSGKTQDTSDVDLQRGLVGWWKLDGNARDATPNANNGTVTGATATTDRKGTASRAYAFSGSAQYISMGNSTTFNSSEVTLAAWVKPTGVSGLQEIIAKELQYKIRLNGTSIDILTSTNGTTWTRNYTVSPGLSAGNWYHIAATISSSANEIKVYVNGAQVGATTNNAGTITAFNTNSLYLATHNAGGELLTGSLDDARFYGRALSAAEISALANQYDPGVNISSTQSGLVGWWKLNGNAKDSTPLANGGTYGAGNAAAADRKGMTSEATSFNGTSNSIITIGNPSDLNITGAITLSAWVKLNDNANYSPIISKDAAAYEIAADFRTGGTYGNLSWRSNGSGTGTNFAGYFNSYIGTWTHVVVTVNGTTATAYRNGQLFGTITIPALATSGANVILGGRSATFFANGSMDDARIYNRALSASEVANLYAAYNAQLNLQSSPTNTTTANINAGLVGYWPFNGNARDVTVFSHNGTLVNAPSLTTDRKGRANSAYSFNGTNQYITMGTATGVQPLTAYTKAVWVKLSSTATGNNIMSGSGACSGHALYAPTSGIVRSGHCGNFAYVIDSTGMTVGTWYFIAVSFDSTVGSGTMKLYKNGTLVSTATSVPSNTETGLQIGSFGTGNLFSGSIDDARLYDRALTNTEISQLYNSYY